MSKNELTIKPTDKLTAGEKVTFNTVNEKGETQEYTYEIKAGDTLMLLLEA